MEPHRSHDYRHLVARWRAVARAAGLRLERFAESDGYPIYCVRTRGSADGGLYVSAGIHGDEPAGCAGLLRWAEKHLAALASRGRALPLLLLPCLNPWGLVNNRRTDGEDHDLNRLFHRNDLATINGIKALIKSRRFGLALHLHEDYDAEGNYIYELHQENVSWGPELLAKAAAVIAPDPRRRIDLREFHAGTYFRHGKLRSLPIHPEAIHLYRRHCPHVFTFETPSEFALEKRVRAQVLMIEECTKRLLRLRHETMA